MIWLFSFAESRKEILDRLFHNECPFFVKRSSSLSEWINSCLTKTCDCTQMSSVSSFPFRYVFWHSWKLFIFYWCSSLCHNSPARQVANLTLFLAWEMCGKGTEHSSCNVEARRATYYTANTGGVLNWQCLRAAAAAFHKSPENCTSVGTSFFSSQKYLTLRLFTFFSHEATWFF